MTNQEIANRLVSNGFVFFSRREKAINARITALSEEQAAELKARFRGSIAKSEDSWQWSVSGRLALVFLIDLMDLIVLRPELRS